MQYLGHDRERWVIDYYRVLLVFLLLIVSARIERTDKVPAVEVVLLCHPVRHGFIDEFGRVAVIGGLLLLELLLEGLVLFVFLQILTVSHSFLELLALALYLLGIVFQLSVLHLKPGGVDAPVLQFNALLVGDLRKFCIVPREVDLCGEVVGECEFAPLLGVNLHIGTLDRNQFRTVGLDDAHLLDTRLDSRQLCLVTSDDVAVLVDEDRTACS